MSTSTKPSRLGERGLRLVASGRCEPGQPHFSEGKEVMLCLTRRPGESIAFILDGKNIGTLTLGSVHSSEWNVRLLFEFDPAVKIVRPDAVNK